MKNSKRFQNFFVVTLAITSICWGLSAVFSWKARQADEVFPWGVLTKVINDIEKLENFEETMEFDPNVKQIQVDSVNGGVDFTTGAGPQIRVLFSGYLPHDRKERPWGTKQADQTLFIKTDKVEGLMMNFSIRSNENSLQGLVRPEVHVTVELPPGWKGSIKGISVSGDVAAKGVNVGSTNLETISGHIEAFRLISPRLNLQSKSGDLDLAESAVESLDAQTISGEVNLNTDARTVSVRSVSGDINLALDPKWLYEFDVESISGEVDNTVPAMAAATKADQRGQAKVKTVSGRIQISKLDPAEEDND